MEQELAALKQEVAQWRDLERALLDEREQLGTIEALAREAGNEESPDLQALISESAERTQALDERLRAVELTAFLRGPYDEFPAILTVSAGAGGRDAADWASLLFRMYQRYGERQGWGVVLLSEHRDPEGGVKSATLEARGVKAYGWLRRETGVHRLVRVSPFDASKRRHTSFASVEVMPVLPQATLREIELKPEELKLETARSSGPGGQNVNRRETAVRLTHLPSGITAECQTERTQGANRERATAMLKAKLLTLRLQQHHEEVARERGERADAAWGNQIRSYVLHPYKLVKDHRTGTERHNPEAVLDGDLQSFIESELTL